MPIEFDQYVHMAELAMCIKGKMMISLNDSFEIRRVFADLRIEMEGIEYSAGQPAWQRAERVELVIPNYDPYTEMGGLF